MLEVFKQNKNFLTMTKTKKDFKYLLKFDTQGAYIEIVDNKNNILTNIDYRIYNGIDREIIRLLQEAKEDNFFTIDWKSDNKQIYLDKYPRLIELLRNSDKLYYKDEIVSFDNDIFKAELHIEKQDKLILKCFIDKKQDFEFISSNYVLIDNKIKAIYNIGENFNHLKDFNLMINEEKLEEILTLLFSYFENIDVVYGDFKLIDLNEKKIIKPAVIFEKVTSENELVLKISASIGKLGPEFFNDFSITKVVLINELEKTITIYECDFSEVFEIYEMIYKILLQIKRKIKNYSFSEDDGLFIIEEEIAKKFIQEHIHTIIQKCEIFGSEKLKKYKYNTTKPTLNVAFKDKIDFLDTGDASIKIEEEEFNLFDFIKLYKKNSYIPLKNGEKALIDKNYIARLERLFKKDKGKIKISFFDLPEIEELIEKKNYSIFKDSKKFYEGFNKLKSSKTKLPKLKNVKLRDYQKQGIKWLKYLYDNNFGGCLADDMGLGKTLQAIGLLSLIYPKEKKPSLIVMPRSLLNNWENEIKRFNPNLSFYTYYANKRDINEIKKHNITLTTYALIRNDIKKLKEIEFDTIILDESQNIKNIESKISKAVMLLNAKHKFSLSGTPIENNLFELYSLFRFLNSGMFRGVNDFKNDYVVPIQTNANEEIAKILKAKIAPFLLRRLKQDVLKDLPPKQEQVVYIEMDEEHKKLYELKKHYYKQILDKQIAVSGIENSQFAIFQALNELRQIASTPELKSDYKVVSSKIDTLFELVDDIILNGHKVLIFANFLGSIDLISQKASDRGIEHLIMTGSTKNRQELVDKFQNDKNIKLFLLTLKVGGVGLNLTEADYVFIFDPWWNKAAENQAIDRVHRIGQKNTVFSYKLITKDTIEEKILKLQQNKQDLTDKIISGDESGFKQLSKEDLDYILG